jgi:hypothetical protein
MRIYLERHNLKLTGKKSEVAARIVKDFKDRQRRQRERASQRTQYFPTASKKRRVVVPPRLQIDFG